MNRGVEMKEQEIKKAVRQRYARAAEQGGGPRESVLREH
jgi:hypothetical protein